MLRRKRKVASVVALVAIAMTLNVGVANAASASGRRVCTNNSTGAISAFVSGDVRLRAPGGTNGSTAQYWVPNAGVTRSAVADRPRGGSWEARSSGRLENIRTYCENGTP